MPAPVFVTPNAPPTPPPSVNEAVVVLKVAAPVSVVAPPKLTPSLSAPEVVRVCAPIDSPTTCTSGSSGSLGGGCRLSHHRALQSRSPGHCGASRKQGYFLRISADAIQSGNTAN